MLAKVLADWPGQPQAVGWHSGAHSRAFARVPVGLCDVLAPMGWHDGMPAGFCWGYAGLQHAQGKDSQLLLKTLALPGMPFLSPTLILI